MDNFTDPVFSKEEIEPDGIKRYKENTPVMK